MILDKDDDRDIVIFAFRYALGRHSVAPTIVMDKLNEIWDQLGDFEKKLIIREIDAQEYYEERIKKFREYDESNSIYSEYDSTNVWDIDIIQWIFWRDRRVYLDSKVDDKQKKTTYWRNKKNVSTTTRLSKGSN